jgi:hypothetical protein
VIVIAVGKENIIKNFEEWENVIAKDNLLKYVSIKYLKNNYYNSDRVNIIMDICVNNKEKIVQKGINIGNKKFKVSDSIEVIRCFRCCGLGHKAYGCKNRVACGYCGEDHNYKDCDKSEPKCVNCVKYNNEVDNSKKVIVWHEVISKMCPCYKHEVEELKRARQISV